jgi:polar amino acid transport system substrate-binding protein
MVRTKTNNTDGVKKETFMRKLTILLVFAASMLVLAACGGGGSDTSTSASATASEEECKPEHADLPTLDSGQLRVAAYSLLPYSNIEGSELGGADGEIITDIAEMECLDINIFSISAAGIPPSVQSGRADTGIGGWYRTKEREQIVNLSDPVYADQTAMVSKEGVSTLDEIVSKGLTVGTTAGNLYVESLQAVLGDNLKVYQADTQAFQDLADGRIDVEITGYGAATTYLKESGIDGMQVKVAQPDDRVPQWAAPGQVNFMTNKDATALTEAFNADIEALRKSGELEKILTENGFPASAADPGPPSLL